MGEVLTGGAARSLHKRSVSRVGTQDDFAGTHDEQSR